MSDHPFDDFFSKLEESVEIKQIERQVKQLAQPINLEQIDEIFVEESEQFRF